MGTPRRRAGKSNKEEGEHRAGTNPHRDWGTSGAAKRISPPRHKEHQAVRLVLVSWCLGGETFVQRSTTSRRRRASLELTVFVAGHAGTADGAAPAQRPT